MLHLGSDLLTRGLEAGPVPVRFSPGLVLALLTMCGLAYVPLAFICLLVSALFLRHPGAPLGVALCTATVQIVVFVTTAHLLRRRSDTPLVPQSRGDAGLVIGAALTAALVCALGNSAVMEAFNILPRGSLLANLFFRWAAYTASIVVVAPAVMVFVAPRLGIVPELPRPQAPRLRGEAIVQSLALLGSLALVYWLPERQQYHLSVLCFAPLAWIALTRGLPGATLAICAINLGGYGILQAVHASSMAIGDFMIFSLACGVVALGLGTIVTLREFDRARLAENEDRLSQVLASARLGFWDCDLVRQQVTYDRTWTEMLGYKLEDVPERFDWWETLVYPDDLNRVRALLQRHMDAETPFYEADYRMRTRDGRWKWIHARGSVVARDAAGKPLRVAGTHLDLTERREAEIEKDRLAHIIEASPDFIASADLNQRLVQINPAFRRLLGIDADVSPAAFSLSQVQPAWAADQVLKEGIPRALAHGQWMGETALRDSQGREVPVSQLIVVQRDEAGRPALISTIARDISPLREIEATRLATERKMLQAQKLESLGVLAGGIAHDFNNLLTVMLGNASLAQLDLPAGSPINHYLEQITGSALRAAELCKQMLAYSGKAQFRPAKLDLSALVDEMTQLVQVSVSKNCALKLELGRDLPAVNIDSIQIRQIVMNLVINASDAIGEDNGVIHLTTGIAQLSSSELAEISPPPEIPPGHYVYLEVSDNGCGMIPEIKARIFEPFFTTKFAGRGLGLAAVLGIVRGHHGALKVQSEPGRGSRFRLLLPATARAAATAGPPPSPGLDLRGHILVVDDEESVRVVAAKILESQGYHTTQADDGHRAVEIFRARPGEYQAVLLDLTMPNLNGEQTFRALREVRADVPIVLMSGFSEEDTMARFQGCELASFVPKPFDREGLIKCVRSAAEAVAMPG
jgi:PAS domain S-box-containing protein